MKSCRRREGVCHVGREESRVGGKRKLKAAQPKNVRSTSNLWFVKAGDLSDPYLWAGYSQREFSIVDAAGKDVPHELVYEGDWVRVKALADVKGATAHFVYGLPKPATLPVLDAEQPFIDITDDNGKVFRFPNVNGDTNVICREVATERDLLYVGGVFYELPAENAGGFACLRPIALADEPVKSIAVDRGLIVVNGKRRVLDSLWKNGTAPQAYWLWREYFRMLGRDEIHAMMLKLGSNTHAEPLDPSKEPANPWDWEHTVSDELRLDEKVWLDVTEAMALKGYNMVVIGLAEGVVYPSHPELAVKGSWSVAKLKSELERLRRLGLEPIPKLNFAASHDTWLKDYHRMVSTKRYYEVCADIIRDTVEMFGHPRFLHLGYDEEMPVAQEKSAYMVVRQGELWWHDFNFFRKEVEKHGVRAWIWSDYIWHHRDEFLKRMPKSVLQSNWYYRTDFGETICDREKMEKKIMSAPWPEYVAGPSAFLDLEAADYDQLPCGSIWADDANMAALVVFCRQRIAQKRLKGFLMAPWLATLESNRKRLMAAVEIGARAMR